jgi:hypothetical protein
MFNHKLATIALLSTVGSVWCNICFAQDPAAPSPPSQPAGGSEATPAPTVPAGGQTTIVVQPPATTTTTTSTWTPYGPLPASGSDPDKGLPSSSREAGTSGFDLGGAGSTATVHGGSNSSYLISGQSVSVPLFHYVRRGDTLWDLCDHYYSNPWSWPRVWSYNPQVENPHWIYPGDRLRLREGEEGKASQSVTGGGFVARRGVVGEGTIFLRNRGYIEDGKREVWGELVGSPDDQMLLTEENDVYIQMNGDHTDVRIGQELQVFALERKPEAGSARGQVVDIKGTVKVTAWDAKTKIARAKVSESLDVMERGNLLGPVGRRFDVVPPAQNTKDVWAKVSGGLNPREILGQNQVVLIDKGMEEGLRPGNRLFAIRQGDPWRKSLQNGKFSAHRMRYQLYKAEVDDAKDTGSGQNYPEEVIGEIRVLRARPHSSTCLVTQSIYELEPGDRVVARRGY